MMNSRKYWLLIVIAVGILAACAERYYLVHHRIGMEAPASPAAPAVAHGDNDFDAPSPYTTYSEVEDGLYVGGRIEKPPEGTRANLSLSYNKDVYTVPDDAWHPIPDGPPAPSLDWLKAQVQFVAKARQAGETTYIHCDAGVSRGPMVTTAYLMYEHHWTRDKALAVIKEHRPFVAPNVYFMDLLLDWEDALKASASATTKPASATP